MTDSCRNFLGPTSPLLIGPDKALLVVHSLLPIRESKFLKGKVEAFQNRQSTGGSHLPIPWFREIEVEAFGLFVEWLSTGGIRCIITTETVIHLYISCDEIFDIPRFQNRYIDALWQREDARVGFR